MPKGRPTGPKTRCNNTWTEAKFNSFIKNLLRQGTMRWAPKSEALKQARLRKGWYLCAECKQEVPATIVVGGKRVKNAIVDHITPIIDPNVGFTSWDECIDRMFCDTSDLQVLCKSCHNEKTNEERALAKERRQREKQ